MVMGWNVGFGCLIITAVYSSYVLKPTKPKVTIPKKEKLPERTPSSPLPPVPPRPPEPTPDPVVQPTSDSKYPVFLWPTQFPGVVTQAFGVNPKQYEPWGMPAHEGIDMKASAGTNIYAVWDGVVSRVDVHDLNDPKAYGNSIRIRHDIDGSIYESVYAHFREPSQLKVGDSVVRGFVIGLAGSTGNSTGPHLHFMLKQFAGELPDTDAQKRYEWPFDIIDATPFFAELRD